MTLAFLLIAATSGRLAARFVAGEVELGIGLGYVNPEGVEIVVVDVGAVTVTTVVEKTVKAVVPVMPIR